jgi:N-acyl amino acid synthase of PEP-CTERM/exosortase system
MFDDRYEVILADNEAARQIHYQVRYKVYCLEEGFEDQSHFDNNEERDEWDAHSVHFTVRTKHSKEWVAAMRMVVRGPEGLPIEQMCHIDPLAAPTDQSTAEISRLCIVDEYRRGKQTHPSTQKGTTPHLYDVKEARPPAANERHHKSEIILGLLRAAVDYSYEHDISNWYFLTTPALARIINRLCIQLVKVGTPCDHRGVRYPFFANLRDAEKQATEGCSMIAEWRKLEVKSYFRFSELDRSVFNPSREILVA